MNTTTQTCQECQGSGKLLANILGDEPDWEPCWLCQGSGLEHRADLLAQLDASIERIKKIVAQLKQDFRSL